MISFTTDTAAFTAAINTAARFTEKSKTQPILGHVLLRASGDRVVVTATDMMMSVTVGVAADAKHSGSITVGAAHLAKVLNTLRGESITLDGLDNHWLRIKAGKSEFKLMGMPDTDYPVLPNPEHGAKGNKPVAFTPVVTSVLADLIGKTAFSISVDEARVNLNGVLFESDGKVGRMVSTDGHRLTLYERPMEGLRIDKGIIIPRKAVIELQRLLDRHPGEVELGIGDQHMFLKAGELTLSARLNNVAFPPYKQVVPAAHLREVSVDRDELLGALRRCEVMAPEKTATVHVRISDGALELSADNPDLGVARHEVAITLENESEFCQLYVRPGRSIIGRRNLVNQWRKKTCQHLMGAGHKVADREQLRRYFDDTLIGHIAVDSDDEFDGLKTVEFWKDKVRNPEDCARHAARLAAPLTINTIAQELTMTATKTPIEITTKTLINGVDVKDYTDSQIYTLIAGQEADIKELEKIEAKPKKLVAEIEKRKAGIAALVTYLDSKE